MSNFSFLQILVSSQTSFPMSDDMYLEGHTSGGVPIDDEDGQDDDSDSGSGSGDFGKETIVSRTIIVLYSFVFSAAVIACGVFGFLSAVFLLILLTYRMKKKDEGSYALGDTKLSTTAYHKAPTKEFYA
uniref:Syndecan n=1 Tax=Monopterus albus TaxID=43700 RepID=A0A3Q3JD47_MONAL